MRIGHSDQRTQECRHISDQWLRSVANPQDVDRNDQHRHDIRNGDSDDVSAPHILQLRRQSSHRQHSSGAQRSHLRGCVSGLAALYHLPRFRASHLRVRHLRLVVDIAPTNTKGQLENIRHFILLELFAGSALDNVSDDISVSAGRPPGLHKPSLSAGLLSVPEIQRVCLTYKNN